MKFVIIATFLLFSSLVKAQIIDVLFEGVSTKKLRTQARKDIMDKSIKETSLKYIAGIIGSEKTERNRKIIDNKIIKQSGKYILYMKGSPLESTKKGIKMNVSLKLSLDNLSKILLANGLLYEMEGPPKVLPMITVEDRVNTNSYSWWLGAGESNAFLKSQLSMLHEKLRASFDEKSFFVMQPIKSNYNRITPEEFKSENPRLEDMLFLSEFFKAHIFIKGKIQFRKKDNFSDKNEIVINFTAFQAGNGRVIADVKRRYTTDDGDFKQVIQKKNLEVYESVTKDLVSQVYAAWQKGTFGSSLIKITFNGDISYAELIDLKNKINHLNEIRGIRERLFAPGKVTFEVDASTLPQSLAQLIVGIKTPHLTLEVDEINADEIEIDVTARR